MPNINRHDVEQWMMCIATGDYHYKDILSLRKVLTPEYDNKLRKIVHDICHPSDPVKNPPIAESAGKKDGYYRTIQEMVEPLDFTVGPGNRCPIVLPFDLIKYVRIDYDNTIVFTGAKDSGKSGILFRTAYLNLGLMNIIILTNMEGGKARLKRRFDAMGVDLTTEKRIQIFYVTENYHDYIRERDTIYIVDYIDVPEGDEFFRIAGLVKKIDQKIQGLNSVAVVGLQKPVGSDFAYGGQQTMKVTSLYVAVDIAKLKIVSFKEPSDEMKEKNISPRNMQWAFQYSEEGTQFYNIEQWYGA